VKRSLRLLQPAIPQSFRQQAGGATALFWWGVIAIFLQFLITGNLLQAIGIEAAIKMHPGSIIVFLCAIYAVFRGTIPLHQRLHDAPGLMAFVIVIPLLGIYSIFFNGYSGSAVYLESFWSAGLLALVMEPATPKQKRTLAKILMALCVFNALVGILESVTHNNWFPFLLDADVQEKIAAISNAEEDFRANAFYTHPLTASLVTAMAIFQLYTMRLRFIVAAPMFGILLVALLAFGGRTALGVTVVVSALAAFYTLVAGIVKRDLKLGFVLAIVSAVIIIPILGTIVLTQTTIGDRILDTLYFDDSAAARATQWAVLNLLSLRNWLFGISMDDLAVLKYQIGLGGFDTDIENFWLLMFLNLGVIGFLVFLGVFGAFLVHLAGHTGSMFGWLLMFSALAIDSTSNSLGVKSNDLFLEAGFLVAIVGFKDFVPAPRTRRLRLPSVGRRSLQNIADNPGRPTIPGLRA